MVNNSIASNDSQQFSSQNLQHAVSRLTELNVIILYLFVEKGEKFNESDVSKLKHHLQTSNGAINKALNYLSFVSQNSKTISANSPTIRFLNIGKGANRTNLYSLNNEIPKDILSQKLKIRMEEKEWSLDKYIEKKINQKQKNICKENVENTTDEQKNPITSNEVNQTSSPGYVVITS